MKSVSERLMQTMFCGICALAFLPLSALAADAASGGFPSGSIWLSKTALTDGDNVQIFAAVYDPSSEKINGDAVFIVDGTSIGSVHFELAPGEAKIASIAWNAKEGAHTIEAEIKNAADTDAKQALALSKDKTESLAVTVAPAPPQPAVVQLLNSAGNAVSGAVSAALPAVSTVAQSVFNETESLRTQAQTALQNKLGNTSPGQVLGVQAENHPSTLLAAAAQAPGFSIVRTIQQILLFIVSSLWIFYPLLLLGILGLFYVLAKAISRRKPAGT